CRIGSLDTQEIALVILGTEVGTARRKRRFEKQFAAGKDEEIASRSVLPRAWMACESVQVAAAKGDERGIENRVIYIIEDILAEYVVSSSTPLAKDGDSRKEEKGRSARVHRVTRSTIIISREKEAEGPARRANRLDTGIRSPEVEGEADYTRKRERGPEANAQSISRTRLGAIASVGGLRTVAGTDRPTEIPMPLPPYTNLLSLFALCPFCSTYRHLGITTFLDCRYAYESKIKRETAPAYGGCTGLAVPPELSHRKTKKRLDRSINRY
ncbi:hypothetical protein ALC60_08361, partial [Trachymyrmex zeteki]